MQRKHMAVIFGFAFALRLIFVAQWHATPYGPDPLLDAKTYHEWAERVAAGHLAYGRAFYMMPLYPYTLGFIYAIFGSNLWVAALFNALLDAGTCVVLADLAFVSFDATAALATGFLAALYRPLIFYTPQAMKESLGIFLLALFTALACRALKTRNARLFGWCGFCLGLAALVRGNVLALAVVILAFIWLSVPALRLKHARNFILGIAVAVLPITLHNAIVSHDFVLTSYAGGFNAYIGHGPFATGHTYNFPRDISSNPGSEEQNTIRVAEDAEGRSLKPSEVSAYWGNLAIDYMIEDPMHQLVLIGNELVAFWSNDEPYDNYDMNFITENFSTVLSWPLINFGCITGFALFAAITFKNKSRKNLMFFAAMVLVYMGTLIPFYVTDRYRLSVVVFLLPMAGVGAAAFVAACRSRKVDARLVIATVVALLPITTSFFAHVQTPAEDAFDWGQLATVDEDDGYHIGAIIALNRALAIAPMSVGADAWIKGADALDNLGHRTEALANLRKIEPLYPADGTVPYNIGRMDFIDGNYTDAMDAFRRSAKKTPILGLAWRGIAAVYEHYGDRIDARAAVLAGLQKNPDDPTLTDIRDKY